MATPYEVKAEKLISETAQDLRENKKLKRPQWALFVKTGVHKERIPDEEDWWWKRAASVLRKLYLKDGYIGVEKLRTEYGGRKEKGSKPEKFHKGGGKIVRTILQEFDELNFTKKDKKKGRKITPEGISYLDKISSKIAQKEK